MKTYSDITNIRELSTSIVPVGAKNIPDSCIGRLICFTNLSIHGNDFTDVYSGGDDVKQVDLYIARTSPRIVLDVGYVAYIKIDKDSIPVNDAEDENHISIRNPENDVYAVVLFADPSVYSKYAPTSTEFDGLDGCLKSVTVTCVIPESVDINMMTSMNLEAVYQILAVTDIDILSNITRVIFDAKDVQSVLAVNALLSINPNLNVSMLDINGLIHELNLPGSEPKPIIDKLNSIRHFFIITSDILKYEVAGVNDMLKGIYDTKQSFSMLFTKPLDDTSDKTAIEYVYSILQTTLTVLPFNMEKIISNLPKLIELSHDIQNDTDDELALAFLQVFDNDKTRVNSIIRDILAGNEVLTTEMSIIKYNNQLVKEIIDSNPVDTSRIVQTEAYKAIYGKTLSVNIPESMRYLKQLASIYGDKGIAVLLVYNGNYLDVVIYNPHNISHDINRKIPIIDADYEFSLIGEYSDRIISLLKSDNAYTVTRYSRIQSPNTMVEEVIKGDVLVD